MDIFISPHKILTQFECGSQVWDFPLWVGPERQKLDQGEYTGLSEPVTFHRKGWLGWNALNLPEAFEYAVRRFLKEFHTPQNPLFDCYSFATLAAGLPLHSKDYLMRFWDIQKLGPFGVFGHNIIFLVDEKRQAFGHAALHIGRNYFLSVQGAGGSLSVSKLSDLRKQYRHLPDIWLVSPKHEILASC